MGLCGVEGFRAGGAVCFAGGYCGWSPLILRGCAHCAGVPALRACSRPVGFGVWQRVRQWVCLPPGGFWAGGRGWCAGGPDGLTGRMCQDTRCWSAEKACVRRAVGGEVPEYSRHGPGGRSTEIEVRVCVGVPGRVARAAVRAPERAGTAGRSGARTERGAEVCALGQVPGAGALASTREGVAGGRRWLGKGVPRAEV